MESGGGGGLSFSAAPAFLIASSDEPTSSFRRLPFSHDDTPSAGRRRHLSSSHDDTPMTPAAASPAPAPRTPPPSALLASDPAEAASPPSSPLGHGDVETQEQHPPCRSTSPAAAAAEEAAAATRRMSAATAPAAIARARFSFARHSANSPRTVLNLGRLMAALEGTEAAYCTTSGMFAIVAVLLQLVGAGGHVVASKCLYGGTHTLLSLFLPCACGIRATFVNADDTHAGLKLVVDNTFMPMVVSPARLGADVVVQSVSKFISGGADIIAGN
ncbi:cystathionine gamma-synthase 1, chloroplastic-like [Ananas comosus]|uniref:Cystathionine gamma-synthase 1, chloroplastic-like n=1 Tax=Ananas comosus TaxID=4615 RepID=A0A6P5FMW5_ANACO|nr:cystathionine gamma-synthase 1, chloroplastic-like [Ananas comosus]